MKEVCEATESNGTKIFLSGWFRVSLIGFSGLMVTILTVLTTNVIANDKEGRKRDLEIRTIAMENRISIAELKSMNIKLDSIKDDLNEFKKILKRTSPYERKK